MITSPIVRLKNVLFTRFAVLLQRVSSSPNFLQFGLGWFFVAQRSTTTTTQLQWYIQVRVQA